MTTDSPGPAPAWHLYVPKLVTTLRQGYSGADFRHDLLAGLTVAIVALPLAMAFAIASGATPDKGLVTAVIAGLLISALGGSRFQIGGPTGAFVVVVYGVIARYGYDGLLLAIVVAAAMVAGAGLPVDTIGSRFGGIEATLPAPAFPEVTVQRLRELLPSAFTIAFLAGVEALLSAVVADGMTGRRHRSNCELVAQGVANVAAALFGGLPATGAIARTATNVRSGARSPVAGMLHALFVLLFMLTLAPLAVYIPMASLAAVLLVVAWNMAEVERFRYLLRGPMGDRLVLVSTFILTVAVDLTVAIEVGVVLASIMFMHRMSEVAAVGVASPGARGLIEEDQDDFIRPASDVYNQRDALPRGVEVFQLRGPLFFGAASRLSDFVDAIGGSPKVFILRMREVPMVDASGAARLRDFVARAGRQGTRVIFSGLQAQPGDILQQMGITRGPSHVHKARDLAAALALARQLVGAG